MILNVSSRTDVVAFYSEWFMNRYKEGFVDVRNPFYPKIVSRVYFEDVKAIFFCTKNPLPILSYLKDINKPIIFQVTLTPYKNDVEPNVISKEKIIEAIKKISNIIGIDNIYVRYDPIFISNKYNVEYHKKAFERMCYLLNGYVKKIIVSFIDDYKNVRKNINILELKSINEEDYKQLGKSFCNCAELYDMSIQTCFENNDLEKYGFKKGKCLSKELAYKLTGNLYKNWKARKCGCVEMVDIGVYNSCKHFCRYCYANYDEGKVNCNYLNHNPKSSLLIGNLKSDDIIKRRYK